jgi:acyl-coenzyme A synthetase/AMP-(fatty) acid ligase
VTDDLAFVAGGALTVTGRADDVTEIGGVRYHGHEIEASIEELPCVEPSYTVVWRTPAGGLAVFFHPRSGTDPDEAAARVGERVATRFHTTPERVEPVAKEEVPKTGTGKLRRAELARRRAV